MVSSFRKSLLEVDDTSNLPPEDNVLYQLKVVTIEIQLLVFILIVIIFRKVVLHPKEFLLCF